jgi:serine/threonine-protein kinase
MDRARWDRLQTLFHEGTALTGPERDGWLAARTTEEPDLIDELTRMLHEDARASSILDRGLADAARDVLGADAAPPGDFGAYRVLRLLGEGGMGVVYLGERSDLGSRAAIKVLRDAWLSPARRERFAAEQRTLAQLEHPAIARLYDAGALADGTPWFVMEYVEGVPITEHCRRTEAGLAARLTLFRAVCQAVRHAHQHLILHRDLKPSNVLVKDDGAVKLLDFGISTQIETVVRPDDTRTIGRLMTPAYAPPERLRGERGGVPTDVYSLGVLLYELLGRAAPLRPGRPRPLGGRARRPPPGSGAAVRRRGAAGRRAPERSAGGRGQPGAVGGPGRALSDRDAARPGAPLPERRGAAPRRGPLLRGRAARGAPGRAALPRGQVRAPQPAERGGDRRGVRGRRGGRQLLRRPSGRGAQRGGRGGGADAAHPALHAEPARGGRGRGEPRGQPARADARGPGLEEARTLDAEPSVQTDLLRTLGGIYHKLGKLERADTLLGEALERTRARVGPDHPDVAAGLVQLGLLRSTQARFEEAEGMIGEALAIDRRALAADHPAILEATAALGRVLVERGAYDRAIGVLGDLVRLRSAGGETAELATAINELADAQFYAGHYEIADSLNRDLLGRYGRLYGERHPKVADVIINLGAIQQERGEYAEGGAAAARSARHQPGVVRTRPPGDGGQQDPARARAAVREALRRGRGAVARVARHPRARLRPGASRGRVDRSTSSARSRSSARTTTTRRPPSAA